MTSQAQLPSSTEGLGRQLVVENDKVINLLLFN